MPLFSNFHIARRRFFKQCHDPGKLDTCKHTAHMNIDRLHQVQRAKTPTIAAQKCPGIPANVSNLDTCFQKIGQSVNVVCAVLQINPPTLVTTRKSSSQKLLGKMLVADPTKSFVEVIYQSKHAFYFYICHVDPVLYLTSNYVYLGGVLGAKNFLDGDCACWRHPFAPRCDCLID